MKIEFYNNVEGKLFNFFKLKQIFSIYEIMYIYVLLYYIYESKYSLFFIHSIISTFNNGWRTGGSDLGQITYYFTTYYVCFIKQKSQV